MNSTILRSLLVCTALSAPMAHAASVFTETFSTDGDTANWFEVADTIDTTLAQEPVSDVLSFSGTAASIFYVAADATSSNGAFSGDYTAAGITGISFTLQLDPGSSMNALVLELTNLTAGETWQYTLTLGAAGAEKSYFVPISADGAGWTQTSGGQNFAFTLSQVEEMGIALSGSTSGNVSGHLDTVSTVPEVSSAVLAIAGFGMALRRRR